MPTAVWVMLTFVVLGELAPLSVNEREPVTFVVAGGALMLTLLATSPL